MPNDMSPISAHDPAARLADRTQRYCRRARTLTTDSALTMDRAACALDHLEALQSTLATERLRQTSALRAELERAEAPFRAQEAALRRVRADLSEALLHAIPDDANLYGQVPQGVQQDAAPKCEKDTTLASAPRPQAASACRALLDLEPLRPYFSASAISQAIESYTKDRRAHDVAGVAYVCLPASALLPCAVY